MRIFFATALIVLFMCPLASAQSQPPNIVLIMADDMGYSDIGCYGGEINTPNLDALAEHGVRFTQFYNAGRCCPTRASLLTGLYPHQAGVGHMVADRVQPGYRGRLNDRCVTIAQVLGSAGYHTVVAGKWHVTPFNYNTEEANDPGSWPLQRGFERFTGSLAGGGNFYQPKGWMVDNEFAQTGEGFYYTDAVADAAVGFIEDAPDDKPVFAYVAFTAPHWPLHAHAEDIDRYEGVYDVGWDAVRASRYERMIEMGIIQEEWPLSPRDRRVSAWGEDVEHREWRAQQMQVYAAMVDRMDHAIGRIVQTLKDTGRYDNTVVLFLADNGGCEERVHMPGIGRFAREGFDTSQWGNRPGVEPGGEHTFQSYGIGWANASNTPFRWYKSEVHEGGITTPLIMHWPAGTADEVRGSLAHDPGHLIDLMTTCADLAGATYPQTFADHAIQPMEGVSLRGALRGQTVARDRPLFFEHEGNAAIRAGRWKLVRIRNNDWELYDLQADRSETNNLAQTHPDRVQALVEAWQQWAQRTNVVPRP